MAKNTQKIGWIGMGRMGYPMAERLLKAGHDVSIWNRTRAKAEPLAPRAARSSTSSPTSRAVDVVFSIVSTGKDLEEVYFGKDGVVSRRRQAAEDLRRLLDHRGRGIGRDPRAAEGARRRLHRRAGVAATPR